MRQQPVGTLELMGEIVANWSFRASHIIFANMGQPAFNYRELPISERVQLVEDIWDSIAQEANVRADALPLTKSQRAELDRRAADADAHPEASVPWETVRDELFERGG